MKYGDLDIANGEEVMGEILGVEVRELGGSKNGIGVQIDNLLVKLFSVLLSSCGCVPVNVFEGGSNS